MKTIKELWAKFLEKTNSFRNKYCWTCLRIAILCIIFISMGWFIHKVFSPRVVQVTKMMTLAPTKQYVDREGIKWSEIKQTQAYKDDIKAIKDSVASSVKGRVETITVYTTITDTFIKKIPVYINDTTSDFSLSLKDTWTEVNVNGNFKLKEASMRLRSQDTLTYVESVKRHLFRSNERIITISSKIPYNHIDYGASIHLKEQKVIAAFGPQISYDLLGNRPVFGIGITLNVLSLKTRK